MQAQEGEEPQRRIVKDVPLRRFLIEARRIASSFLDKFDALVNDLSVGLPAELAARRKQYEHYRDRLLTFEEAVGVSEAPASAVRPDRGEFSESTVVAEWVPDAAAEAAYQSEAELERELIRLLQSQAYEYLPITSEADLVANLRVQLEALNQITFSDAEWDRFFAERIAGAKDGITEKTVRIQEDHVQLLKRDDGSTKNITLLDKTNIHNNRLQVINQYEVRGLRQAQSSRFRQAQPAVAGGMRTGTT